jgi:hypothetical protein
MLSSIIPKLHDLINSPRRMPRYERLTKLVPTLSKKQITMGRAIYISSFVAIKKMDSSRYGQHDACFHSFSFFQIKTTTSLSNTSYQEVGSFRLLFAATCTLSSLLKTQVHIMLVQVLCWYYYFYFYYDVTGSRCYHYINFNFRFQYIHNSTTSFASILWSQDDGVSFSYTSGGKRFVY